MNKYISAALVGSLSFSSLFLSQAQAVPYPSMDPRTLAMGGAGVASGSSANAAFLNPALLGAAKEDDRFSVELPIVGGRFHDQDDLMDELDNYQNDNLESNLTDEVERFLVTPSNDNARRVGRALDSLTSQMEALKGDPVGGEIFAGMVVGIPNKKIGASLAVSAWAVGGAVFNVEQSDLDLISSISANAYSGDPNNLYNDPTIQDHLNYYQGVPGGEAITDKLTSNLEVRGAAIREVALALSHEVKLYGHSFAVGLTPKLVRVRTFDYQLGLDDADIKSNEGTRDHSNMNLDIGVAKNYDNGWRTAAVIKNLVGQDYKTVAGNTVSIKPQVRVGAAHSTDWATVTLDMDLTENDAVGFESKSQYICLGAELDAFDTVQLRAGYRYNMADSVTSIPTIGIGFSPFGAHLDLAVAGNGSEIAGSAQLGFRF